MIQIKTSRLKLVFSLMGTQTDEITVRSSADGWRIFAVSADRVSMACAELPENAFEQYEDSGDFAVSLKNVLKALGSAGETCSMDLSDGRFTLSSDGMRVKFPQLTVAESDSKVPNLEYHAGATLTASELTKIGGLVFGTIDAYSMQVVNDTLVISALDGTGIGAEITISKDQCLSINGTAKSTFPIENLDRFMKAVPKDAVMDVNLGDDIPVTIDIQDEYLKIRFLLAPRIEQE